ncbi:MAG: hypothetical protein ABIP30_01930 [Ferruginibacter sp.]
MKTLLKKSLLYFGTFLLTTTIFFACQKEISDTGFNPGTPGSSLDLTTKVTASSISGFVTDENNKALIGATVKIGTTTILTDKYGFFEARNSEVVKNAALITVTQVGYFKGIKTYIAENNKAAFFRIKLIPKTPAGSFSAASGGTITTSTGIKIIFPATAIINGTTGAAYTGNVNVAANWIDPSAKDLNNIMPGDLRGLDKNNAPKKLTTYGMAAIELTGTSGELLQIAPGKKVSLSIPTASSITATAPATIPLWYFDETVGLWKEEGSAVKSGNIYTGDVSHFSFWNCDMPADYVQFNCTIKDAAGNPASFIPVKIYVVNNPQSATWGYTDSSGYVAGAVPGNTQLKLEVFSSLDCSNALYSQTFTTAAATVSLGLINLNIPTIHLSVLSGTVTNCNNAPVSHGYIIMSVNNLYYRYTLSSIGSYQFSHLLCNGTENAVLIGEDIDASQQNATSVNYTINSGNNNVPNIAACGASIVQFINYSAKGIDMSLTFPIDSFTVSSNSHTITGFNKADFYANDITFVLDYTASVGSKVEVTNLLSTLTLPQSYVVASPIMATITENGGPGQYISGNFTASLNDKTPGSFPPVIGAAFTFKCSFRIKRP